MLQRVIPLAGVWKAFDHTKILLHREDRWQLANPEFTGKMAVETVNMVGDMISLLLGPTL